MGRLIDDLLTFARTGCEPLVRREVDSVALVRLCVAELTDEFNGRDVRISIGDLPACSADPALLKQVWLNLLGNAIKYSRQRPITEIVVGSRLSENTVAYFCRDNGAGFDLSHADKIFGVFQRLHRADEYEGTGVGLAIVEQVIRRHGGRIWAQAEVNRGATFYFTLGTHHPAGG
jgi:light-regulated signal transduction histidine kinase (bacteriophytochrome)